MPTNYTPDPGNAPATITLPSDLDDATAESVNLPMRAIADNLMGLAAIKANNNTMAGVTTFLQGIVIDEPSASIPLIKTTLASTKDSNPSNAWQPILDSENVRIYTGVNSGAATGGFAITYNAKWVAANNRWESQNSTHNCIALLVNYGDLYISGQRSVSAGGPANWAAWPAYGSPNQRGDLFVSRNLNVGGDITGADNGIFSNALVAPYYDYPSSIARSTILYPEGGYDSALKVMALSASESAIYKITVPSGAILGEVTVKVREGSGTNYEIHLYKVDGLDFSSTDVSSLSVVTDIDNATFGPGVALDIHNHTLTYGGMTVDNPNHVYYVRVYCQVGSPAGLDVWGVRLLWNDPGPRNH